MADEIEEVDAELAAMAGPENSWTGRVLVRVVVVVKTLRARVNAQAGRLQQLEDRVTALEEPPAEPALAPAEPEPEPTPP